MMFYSFPPPLSLAFDAVDFQARLLPSLFARCLSSYIHTKRKRKLEVLVRVSTGVKAGEESIEGCILIGTFYCNHSFVAMRLTEGRKEGASKYFSVCWWCPPVNINHVPSFSVFSLHFLSLSPFQSIHLRVNDRPVAYIRKKNEFQFTSFRVHISVYE